MRNKVLFSLLLFPIIGLCTQQYVISNEQTPYAKQGGPINIYAPSYPKYAAAQQMDNNANNNNANQQQTSNPNHSQDNFYQPQKQDWWENKKNQQPPEQQPQAKNRTQLQQGTAPVPVADSSTNQVLGYDEQQEQLWQKSCLNSVTDPKVAAYAQKYCACGWRHISSGELPIKYLTSNSASDIKAGNTILRVIKDECMAEVVGSQGAPK